MRSFSHAIVLIVFVLCVESLSAQLTRDDVLDVLPPDMTFDAAASLTVRSPEDVASTRAEIKRYLWRFGMLPVYRLPTLTSVYGSGQPWPNDLIGLSNANVASVDRLLHNVGYELGVQSYLIHSNRNQEGGALAIVHQGHSSFENKWEGGIDATIERLLEEGYTVMAMQMPQKGWNQADGFISIAGKQHPIDSNHDTLFELLGESEALRVLVQPVISSINLYLHQYPAARDIAMVGLSGGGWTTHFAAAVDPRITLSIPVAGIVPLDLNREYPYSLGDGEQVAPGLTEGIASYLDLFVLGAEGNGRRQIQILNQFDTCCFYGIGHETYIDEMELAMRGLDSGEWNFVLDSTHVGHQISPFAFKQIVDSASLLNRGLLGDCNNDRRRSDLDFACVDSIESRDAVITAIGSLLGDLNGDGIVTIADFLILSANYGRVDTAYSEGDIDLSGEVGFNDFLALSGNLGAIVGTSSMQTVPEPRFWAWAWGSVASFFFRCMKRRAWNRRTRKQ